uniref:Uncharacterized protein n=1 Tax=Moniliophthora roreri TaxID=221103 RepID=A0A0W0FFY9_MONRR
MCGGRGFDSRGLQQINIISSCPRPPGGADAL